MSGTDAASRSHAPFRGLPLVAVGVLSSVLLAASSLLAVPHGERPSEPPPAAAPEPAPEPEPEPEADPAPEPEPEPAPRSFSIAAAGDILPHAAVNDSAAANADGSDAEHDFRPMFAQVAPLFRSADLAVCHIEAPLSRDNQDVVGGGEHRTPDDAPLFNAPFELADAIADTGFDACSTAHNHSSDAGEDGIRATIDHLERVGVVPAGTAADPQDAGVARIHHVRDVTVAHLAATYGLNRPLPEDRAWMVDEIDPDAILDAAAAARDDGAEFVVVSLHLGLDYQVEPADNQRRRADVLLGSDEVDLLIGHHTHVVQPIERVHDKVAVHGLGNLLSNMHPDVTGPRTQDGVVVVLDVVEDPGAGGFVVDEVTYVPTWVDRDTHEIVDVRTALDAADPGELDEDRRGELEASWDRTVDAITRDGADDWGVRPR